MTRGAAKADAKLAVKSKGAEKPVRGKDPVKGSKGKAAKTVNDLEEEANHAHDPNMPKRPICAFYVFQEEFRKQNPGKMSIADAGKAIGDAWKDLGKKGQATYEAIAL